MTKATIAFGVITSLGGVLLPARAEELPARRSPAGQVEQARSEGRSRVQYPNWNRDSCAPFSEAVRVGDLLILSGKIGTDAAGKLVSGGIKAETRHTLENIRRALEAYGSSLDDAVKCTVMLADVHEWKEMNEVYTTFFKKDRLPTRSALGGNGLAPGARVEIACWAVLANQTAAPGRPPGASAPARLATTDGAEGTARHQPTSWEDGIVTTKHEVAVAGRTLQYTARAGRLPILDNETGTVLARMFFTAYKLDSPPGPARRPLLFLWNGGPGANSSLVHLLGFGPRRLRADGSAVDNPGTWLDLTDLVFVDPVGTGYSRPVRAEYGPAFYQTRGDAESVAEFIRVYRNRFEAWDAPLFLGGESYGVTRAAGVADILERRGIPVHGAVLISGNLPLGQLTAEQQVALTLPSYTAAAFANKKLSPELQGDLPATLRQAEAWARTEYAALLARRDQLDDAQRQAALMQLARFTGLDPDQIDRETLSVGRGPFAQRLLAGRKQVVGHYDSRLVGPYDPSEKQYDPTKDPSLKGVISDVGVLRYFRNELQYRSDLSYQGPFGGGYPAPSSPRGDWMSVKWDFQASKGPQPEQPLLHALTANPRLQVLVASGCYDLACSYYANEYLASHLEPKLARNVTARTYRGGHAIYLDLDAQMELKRDVAQFIQNALGPAR
jgi:reactive intermediate/imine deaminase